MFCAYYQRNCGFGDTLNEAYQDLLGSYYSDKDTDEINISDVYFYKHIKIETKVIITEA